METVLLDDLKMYQNEILSRENVSRNRLKDEMEKFINNLF